jgi:hypothetical protein
VISYRRKETCSRTSSSRASFNRSIHHTKEQQSQNRSCIDLSSIYLFIVPTQGGEEDNEKSKVRQEKQTSNFNSPPCAPSLPPYNYPFVNLERIRCSFNTLSM